MNKIFFWALISAVLASCNRMDEETQGIEDLEKIVFEKAKKYGLEDSIKMVITEIRPFPKNCDHPLCKEGVFAAMADSMFANYMAHVTKMQEYRRVEERQKAAKSMQEYYQIFESSPRYLKEYLDAIGGWAAYEQEKKERMTPGKYKVYLDKEGAMVFVPADSEYNYGTFLFKS